MQDAGRYAAACSAPSKSRVNARGRKLRPCSTFDGGGGIGPDDTVASRDRRQRKSKPAPEEEKGGRLPPFLRGVKAWVGQRRYCAVPTVIWIIGDGWATLRLPTILNPSPSWPGSAPAHHVFLAEKPQGRDDRGTSPGMRNERAENTRKDLRRAAPDAEIARCCRARSCRPTVSIGAVSS